MNKVELKELGKLPVEFIDGDRGVNYPKKTEFMSEGYCLFLNTGNVTSSGFYFNELDFITEEKDNILRKGKLQRGDIVLTTRGTVGNVAFFNDEVEYDNIRINSGMVILRVDSSLMNPYFLYSFLQSEMFLEQVLNQGSGSAQPQLPISSLKNIVFPWVDKSVQDDKTNLLKLLDEKIELNDRILEHLERLGRAVYEYWFTQYEFPTENGSPYISSVGEFYFDETAQKKIPVGWKLGSVSDLASNRREVCSPDGTDVPYVGLEHMNKESIVLSRWGSGKQVTSNKYSFKEGDILFGKLRPYFKKVAIAPLDGICSTDILSVSPRDESSFAFLLLLLSSDSFIDYNSNASKGTRMPRTSWEIMNNYPLIVPTIDVVKKFNVLFEPIKEKILSCVSERHKLEESKRWLLPMMLNGQISIER